MVSRNPNPGDGFYLEPTGMTLTGLVPFSPTSSATTPSTAVATVAATATATDPSSEDSNKKVRKPYTITKSRESWTEPEHDKFLEALQLFDRDWKKIEAFIGSKTVIQIRSHAQKYFLKVQKSGTGEHLPPPRPKRKAAHPYPQKATRNAQTQVSGPLKSTSALNEPGYMFSPDSSSMPINSATAAAAPSWTSNMQTISFSPITKGAVATNKCSNSSESTPRTRPSWETTDQGNHGHTLRVLPDFAQVYSFIGSVFDPCVTGHLQKLKKMDPIDVETVLLLMRNLSINLVSPDFEDHRQLLASYDTGTETTDYGSGASLNKEKSKIAT